MVTVTLPDGSQKSVDAGITVGDFVKNEIGEGLFRASIAAKINDEVVGLYEELTTDCNLTILTFKDREGQEVYWHSTAHVLAIAVLRVFPDVKLTIGPPIEEGFFYDFATDHNFTDEDLEKIQAEMKKVCKEGLPFTKRLISYEEAKELFKDNKFKLEIVEEYKDSQLSTYSNGDEFEDLCRGPHVLDTSRIKALKLTKYSGAYWRGNAENEQLQRIYGISFPSKDQLKEYTHRIEEAMKRDHRKLVKDHDLVMFHEWAPGAPFFLQKGTIIYNELLQFIRGEYNKRGYEEVITPQMFNKALWEQSGHWEHYQDDMFSVEIEGHQHSLKPMNCPSHCLIFNRDTHSYKDLPIRIADFCCLHRNELSGALSGLTRVRKFAQDDGHIFCRLDQVEDEVLGVLNFFKYVWNEVFDFELNYNLSTRPDEKLGDDALWDRSEKMLASALEKAGIEYGIKEGDGAFYGPKIDIEIKDALGRSWQCPTCQLDFCLPERFKTMYEGEDGKKHQAVMIHRAVLGSLERFFAMLVEHYAAKFPLWLSPEQVRFLPIADRHVDYCKEVAQKFKDAGLRAAVDSRLMTTNKKVREAQLEHVNYILVVGDKEVENKSVNVRTRDNVVHGEKQVDTLITELREEIDSKK